MQEHKSAQSPSNTEGIKRTEEWEKEYIPELGNRYTLKDVEMIQEGVRQHQSDKE